ncbi:MAG: DUF4224 domain-containing protein [Burkholderiaceae bacterium]
MYLLADQLAALTGYKANQFAHMRNWLTQRGWPFETSSAGMPVVLKAYHDARLSSTAGPAQAQAQAPNRAALETLHARRKTTKSKTVNDSGRQTVRAGGRAHHRDHVQTC